MIEESYVSFDTAKMLKEAGFEANLKTRYVEEEKDEWAFWASGTKRSDYNYFDDTIACPTLALAARWLREVHGLFIEIFYRITGFNYEIIYTKTYEVAFTPHEPKINFISYEGCLEDALQEAVKLIKK